MNLFSVLEENFFESAGLISGAEMADSVWESYQAYAIPKLEEFTTMAHGAHHFLSQLSQKAAAEELKKLRRLQPIMKHLRAKVMPIRDERFTAFKNATVGYLDAVNLIYAQLLDLSDTEIPLVLSEAVLAEDWNQPEDDHWDKY